MLRNKHLNHALSVFLKFAKNKSITIRPPKPNRSIKYKPPINELKRQQAAPSSIKNLSTWANSIAERERRRGASELRWIWMGIAIIWWQTTTTTTVPFHSHCTRVNCFNKSSSSSSASTAAFATSTTCTRPPNKSQRSWFLTPPCVWFAGQCVNVHK